MTRNGFDGGDDTRMNFIIAAATEFFDDVLDQVHMVLDMSDHSILQTLDNGLIERDNVIRLQVDIIPGSFCQPMKRVQ